MESTRLAFIGNTIASMMNNIFTPPATAFINHREGKCTRRRFVKANCAHKKTSFTHSYRLYAPNIGSYYYFTCRSCGKQLGINHTKLRVPYTQNKKQIALNDDRYGKGMWCI